mgnify:CR=1 FL=1
MQDFLNIFEARFRLSVVLLMALAAVVFTPRAAGAPVDTLLTPAERALVDMPSDVLDIVPVSARLDMIDYLRADTLRYVPNAMNGLSRLMPPVTDSFVEMEITPVSTLQIKILPERGGKNYTVGVSYTVGDTIQAMDSELMFFTSDMKPLKRTRFIRLARTEDFLVPGLSGKGREEILSLVPFPAVEYRFSPDGLELRAILTVDRFMSLEDYGRLKPHLMVERMYRWNGKKYVMERDK